MTPEKKVKESVIKLLKKCAFINGARMIWWYMPQAGIYGKMGIPDFIGCVVGKLFAVECKANRGVLTQLQRLCLIEIRNSGGIAFVVTSSKDNQGLEQLEIFLKEEITAHIVRNQLNIPQP